MCESECSICVRVGGRDYQTIITNVKPTKDLIESVTTDKTTKIYSEFCKRNLKFRGYFPKCELKELATDQKT